MIQSSTIAEFPPFWEIVKGILMFTATSLLAWIAHTLADLVKRQTKLEHIVVGVDGNNGMRSRVHDHDKRIGDIEERNIALDAVAEVERQEYEGEERRHGLRRLRDIVREEMQHLTPRSPAT